MASKTLQITLNATDNASATFQKTGNAAKTMGDSITGAADKSKKSIADLSGEMTTVGGALTGFGAGITAAMGFAINSANQLESAMANVNSIARVSKGELTGLTGQVRDLAVELAASPTDLADGLYDIVSSGFEASEAMDILEASAVAARAGLTTTATAATAVTAVLNAYGLEASEAGDVSDVLFKTVDSGVITFEELAGSMGRVLPLASTLSVGIEELGAAYAEMTLQGISASEAETGLSAIMTAAISPTTALADAVREYGYESAEALIQAEGLAGFLEFLDATAGGSAAAMSELTGNVRATNAALILSADGASGYTAALADMESAAQGGAYTQEVLAIQMDTTAASIDRMQAVISNLALTVGGTLQPAVRTSADAMTGLAAGVDALPSKVQSVATVLTAAAGGVSLLGGAALLAAPRILATRTALQSLGGVTGTIGVLARSFGPVGLAITAVTLAAGFMVSKYGEAARASEELAAVNDALNDTFVDLRLNGIDTSEMEEYARALNEIRDIPQPDAFHIFENTDASAQELALLNDIVDAQHDVSSAEFTAGMDTYIRAITDARISTQEFFTWYDAAVAKMLESTTDEFGPDWFFKELADLDLSQFRKEADGAADAIDDTTEALTRYGDGIDRYVAKQQSALEILASLEQAERDNLAWQTERERTAYANQEIGPGARAEQEAAAIEALTGTLETLNEAQTRVNETYMEWLGNGGNILGFLDDFGAATQGGLESWAAFADEFNAGLDMSNANAAFDAVLNIFSQIDSLGSRASAGGAIADALFGPDGDPHDSIGPLRDLYDAGRIGQEQFNQAVAEGIGIQYSTLRIQEDLNKIRVDQLPLLVQEQSAYELQIDAISQLEPLEQRRALALQDTAVQAQLATQYSTAYAASVGEIPEEVATNMIVSAAEADSTLADLLVQFGLIEEYTGPDGEQEFRVIFPDGDTVEQAVTGLTNSIDALIITMGGVPPLRIEADTEEATGKVVAFGDYVLDIDGVRASMGIDADTSDATTALDTTQGLLANLDGKIATVSVRATIGDAGSALGNAVSGVASNIFGLPESIDIAVTATTSGGPEVEALSSAVADLPPSASVAVSVDAQGFAEIGSLFDMVRALDETSATITVDADTSAVDSALARYGGAVDNPTGGAAGLAPVGTAQITFTADTSEIDSWTPPEFEPVELSIISSTHGAQIALDNVTSAIDNIAASNIMVTVGADTGTAITALNDVVNAANNLAISHITVNVSADTGTAVTGLNSVTVAANAIPESVEISVISSTHGAQIALDNTAAAANAIPESESIIVVALAEGATFALNGVTAAANAIPESESVTVSVFGAAGAVSALNSVTNAANSIPSSRSTTITTNRVTNNVQTYSSRRGGAYAHGGMVGVPHFAGGGMVPFWAGENGPEVAHFAHGGSALIPYEGLYAAPPMTYISPNNARGNSGAFDFDIAPMTDRIDEARAALEGFADDAPNYGDNITAGLAQGIEQGAPVVSNAAIGVMDSALAAAKASAGIASAAAEWVQPGIEMDNGLAQGILAGESTVVNAAVQVVKNALRAAQLASARERAARTGGIVAEDLSVVNANFYDTLGEGIRRSSDGGLETIPGSAQEAFNEWVTRTGKRGPQWNFDWFKRTYGYAHGGMVPFWAGENGPEMAHFAGGGTALLPHEGLYAAPPMTYISPNNAVSNEYGGHTFNIAVTGGNREEIRAVFADEIVPEIGRAMREYERGMGV